MKVLGREIFILTISLICPGFTPIINPPDVAIISMSKTYKRLVLAEELDIMPIAMSYDHRVINGADAGRFMVFLKELLDSYD